MVKLILLYQLLRGKLQNFINKGIDSKQLSVEIVILKIPFAFLKLYFIFFYSNIYPRFVIFRYFFSSIFLPSMSIYFRLTFILRQKKISVNRPFLFVWTNTPLLHIYLYIDLNTKKPTT